MSVTRSLARQLRIRPSSTIPRALPSVRYYSDKPEAAEPPKDVKKSKSDEVPISSCPAGTVLAGVNYLKGQPPVLAKPDEEYPSWLWDLLKPKVFADMSPGSRGEKALLRKANKQGLKEQNFLKTQ